MSFHGLADFNRNVNVDSTLTARTVTATTCNCPSDARFKTSVKPIPNALEKLQQIDGVTFSWNEEARNRFNAPQERVAGVLAQQVEQTFPEVVHTDDNGLKSVSYDKLTALLIEAVKAQQKIIDEQGKQIRALQKAFVEGRAQTSSTKEPNRLSQIQ